MVSLFNCFEVPAGLDDEFLRLWTEVNAYMVTKRGYVSHELHRSLQPDAHFRFLNHAMWESPEDLSAAHDVGFRELVSRTEWSAFRSTPALYEVVHSGTAAPVTAQAAHA